MHDVGKIGVRYDMLNKPGKLTPEEVAVFRQHPEKGKRILEPVPCLHGLIDGCWCHHEWFDGGGYPRGLVRPQHPARRPHRRDRRCVRRDDVRSRVSPRAAATRSRSARSSAAPARSSIPSSPSVRAAHRSVARADARARPRIADPRRLSHGARSRQRSAATAARSIPTPLAYPRDVPELQDAGRGPTRSRCRVVLVPVVDGDARACSWSAARFRRGIGKLALVGGFLEEHETWQTAARARCARRPASIDRSGDARRRSGTRRARRKPNRVLLFAVAPPLPVDRAAAVRARHRDHRARPRLRPRRPRRGVRVPAPHRGGAPLLRERGHRSTATAFATRCSFAIVIWLHPMARDLGQISPRTAAGRRRHGRGVPRVDGRRRGLLAARSRSSACCPGYSDNPAFAQMFIAEAQISSRLVHPNIVSVLDFDRDAEGRLFLVMELVEGKDLDALVATGLLPFPVVIFVISEVLRGLGYAHDLPDRAATACAASSIATCRRTTCCCRGRARSRSPTSASRRRARRARRPRRCSSRASPRT